MKIKNKGQSKIKQIKKYMERCLSGPIYEFEQVDIKDLIICLFHLISHIYYKLKWIYNVLTVCYRIYLYCMRAHKITMRERDRTHTNISDVTTLIAQMLSPVLLAQFTCNEQQQQQQ